MYGEGDAGGFGCLDSLLLEAVQSIFNLLPRLTAVDYVYV